MGCRLCGFEATTRTCNNNRCQICITVADVDEEINQVLATLQQLIAKRSDLRSEINRTHSTFIYRLPTELKNYIFELLVPSRNRWGLLPTDRPVIPYTSVCRDWRDTAWSNPHLWSTIRIPLERVASLDPSNFVHDWILRSRNLPLNIRFAHKGNISEEGLQGLIDDLSQCCNRWHSLSFTVSPKLFRAFHHSNIQCHLLKTLCIRQENLIRIRDIQPLSNPTMSPENIEIYRVPFQSLQISWNQLTSAKVNCVKVQDLVQLFRHAPQMTYCHISTPFDDKSSQIPPITHQRLKTLRIDCAREGVERFLESLVLPSLQEFHADQFFFLKYFSAIVHRTSCPLGIRITFDLAGGRRVDGVFDHLRPLLGVTDLVLEHLTFDCPVTVKIILLEGYFPDLRCLTMRLGVFHWLWDEGIIHLLLGREPPNVECTTTKRIHDKMVVILDLDSQQRSGAFDIMKWNPIIGKQLKALQLDVCWREDGFEISIPED